jgi:isoleucyl-tRNA synthetase
MGEYRLFTIVKGLLSFLDDLTKWYIRLNRPRIRGDNGDEEMQQSLNTLFDVLLSTTQMMSCFTPFISEFMYLNLRNGLPEGHAFRKDSIHFLQIPEVDQSLIDKNEDNSVLSVDHMKQIIEIARLVRDQNNLPIKKPVLKMKVINKNPNFLKGFTKFEKYVKEEVNCLEIELEPNEEAFVYYKVDWDKRALGRRLGKAFKAVEAKLSSLPSDVIKEYIANGTIEIDGVAILANELIPSRHFH